LIIINKQRYDIDYSKLLWQSDWMYSEVIDDTISDEEDFVVGCYSSSEIPEISMYIDMERNKVLEVWTSYEEDEN